MQTDTSAPQSHSLIASDRVEGTPVRPLQRREDRTIERLMIDKLSGNGCLRGAQFRAASRMGTEARFPSRGRD